MRPSAFVAVWRGGAVLSLLVSCSSDPAPPKVMTVVDPGIEQEGGIEWEGGGSAGGSGSLASEAGSEAGLQGDTSSAPPAYPAGPYGHGVGTVLQDFVFSGLRNPKAVNYVVDGSTMALIAIHEFYNPSKDSLGPKALVVTASAQWCSACQLQATHAMEDYNYWHPQGVEFLEALFEDQDSDPATPTDLQEWTQAYQLEYPTVLDPSLKLGVFFNKSAAPFNMIVDLSSMTIVEASEGAMDLGPDNRTLAEVVGL